MRQLYLHCMRVRVYSTLTVCNIIIIIVRGNWHFSPTRISRVNAYLPYNTMTACVHKLLVARTTTKVEKGKLAMKGAGDILATTLET